MKEKAKRFFNNRIVLALLFNLGVFAVLMMIAYPQYSTDIDILMQSILYGVGSWGPESHLIYTNILVGKVLKELLIVAPGVAWYSVMQFVLVFLALLTVTYVLLRRPGNLLKRLIVLFFLCFAGYECYITPSYAKTAIILCLAGFCLLVDAMMDGEEVKVRYICCALLFLISSLISFRIFLVAAVICFAGILIMYLKRTKLRPSIFGIVALLVAAGLVAGSQGFDHYKYASDEIYSAERENARAIEKMYVFGAPDYTDKVEELTGLSKDEYNALASGRFVSYDDNVTDYFQIVSGIGNPVNGKQVVKFFRTVPIRMFQYALFFCCLILVALTYLSNRKNKRILILPIVIWLGAFLVFYFGNAWSGTTVSFIVLLPICVFTLMQYGKLSEGRIKGLAVFTCLFALVMYSQFHSKLVTSVKTDSIEEHYMNLYNPEKVYANDAANYLKGFNIFQVYPEGLYAKDNICIVDGIYRDVRGFERNIFVDDAVLEKGVAWYKNKPVKDILIEYKLDISE